MIQQLRPMCAARCAAGYATGSTCTSGVGTCRESYRVSSRCGLLDMQPCASIKQQNQPLRWSVRRINASSSRWPDGILTPGRVHTITAEGVQWCPGFPPDNFSSTQAHNRDSVVFYADLGWQVADLAIADDVLPSSSAADSSSAQPASRPGSAPGGGGGGGGGVTAALLLPPRLPEPLVHRALHTLLASWEVNCDMPACNDAVSAAGSRGSSHLPAHWARCRSMRLETDTLCCLVILVAVWTV